MNQAPCGVADESANETGDRYCCEQLERDDSKAQPKGSVVGGERDQGRNPAEVSERVDEPTGAVDGWTAVEPVPVEVDVVPEDAAALAVAPEEVLAVPGIV